MTVAVLVKVLLILLLLVAGFAAVRYFIPAVRADPFRIIVGGIFAVVALFVILDAVGVLPSGVLR